MYTRHLLLFFLLIAGQRGQVKEQQDPYYSHFRFVQPAYNPASIGQADGALCLSMLTHNQWRSFTDQTFADRNIPLNQQQDQIVNHVAPVTHNFNLSGQIARPCRKPIGAIGLSLFEDRLGYMRTAALKVQAAFFVPLNSRGARLSLGMDIGFTQFGFVNPKFHALHLFDPKIPSMSSSQTQPDIGIGLHYRNSWRSIKKFYLGASVSHITGATYNLPGTTGIYNLERHYYVHAGLSYPLPSGFNELEPNILVKYNTTPQVDLNLTLLHKRTFRVGLGYRQWGTADALTILAGYVHGLGQVGYSYDITLSRIQGVSNGTHEIFLKYCFQLPSKGCGPKKTIREL